MSRALIENQEEFFKKYYILAKEFEYNEDLDWNELLEIYKDYKTLVDTAEILQSAATKAFIISRHCHKIHSVRYRLKDPEHLIEKIIREKIRNKNNKLVTRENYKDRIEDLVGIRLLHVFKDDWKEIHDSIGKYMRPIIDCFAYHADDEDEHFIRELNERDITIKKDADGYRSIHYSVLLAENMETPIRCEFQVRTLFEEAWSEVSHATRYPYDQDNQYLSSYLKNFNRLTASLDEMGTFIRDSHYNQTIDGRSNVRNEWLEKIDSELTDAIDDQVKLNEIKKTITQVWRSASPKSKKFTKELPNRVEYFEQAIKCLSVSPNYYRAVTEGPSFLHPEWVFKLREADYMKQNVKMPNYDKNVCQTVFQSLNEDQTDICFIIRNSQRYINKLNRIIPVEKRNKFKTDVIKKINALEAENASGKLKLLCIKTGFISVSEIYQTSALESDKFKELLGLTNGYYHEDSYFVNKRRAEFDSIFVNNFDSNRAQFDILRIFIQNLWLK